MDPHRIDIAVESLCLRGCQAVNHVIEQLQDGQTVAGTERLSGKEREQVRQELQAIMAVYDRPCDL